MHVEECCQALLSHILPEVDRERSGLAIDIGVGDFGFYCQLFQELGFSTIAVEPLPTQKLRKLCRVRNIHLIESCLSDIDGFVNIYIGSYNGKENLNLNSLRPDWWGSSATTKQVRSMKLSEFLKAVPKLPITCMKIDVEGMEFSIVKQFPFVSDMQLPKVLMFEYGGGSTIDSGQGGWSKEILDGTMRSLQVLYQLGYDQTIRVDAAANTQEQIFSLQSILLEPKSVFARDSRWGNIILFRKFYYSPDEIHSICRAYQDNNSVPIATIKPPNNLFERTFEKIQKRLLSK